jgi:hypothetical protein
VPDPVQQPFGQEVASQTHWPVLVMHSVPVGHAAHVAPLLPHDEFDSFDSSSHAPPPVQQPAQAPPPPHEQTPLEHESPLLHDAHAAPAVPHWPGDCPE